MLHHKLDGSEEETAPRDTPIFFNSTLQPDNHEQELVEVAFSCGKAESTQARSKTLALGPVWLEYLSQLKIAAAIIHCEPLRPASQRMTFFVGFEGVRGQPETVHELLAFAKTVWQREEQPGVTATSCAHSCGFRAMTDQPAALAHLPLAAAINRSCLDYHVHAVFLREKKAGAFTRETLATLHLTIPLFLCSASRQTALKRLQRQTSVLRGMLDWLDLGMLVLDQKGRLVTSNAAGDALIASERLLSLAQDGSLVCRRPPETKALRSAIEQVCLVHARSKAEFVVKLSDDEERSRLGFVLGASPSGDPHWQHHALLLVLPARPSLVSPEMLDTLGLLPSEQRFLMSFLEANSLAEGAANAGVSDETAKTYLKRIRSKLGVRRQIELAQLIYGQSPPLRTDAARVLAPRNGGPNALF